MGFWMECVGETAMKNVIFEDFEPKNIFWGLKSIDKTLQFIDKHEGGQKSLGNRGKN